MDFNNFLTSGADLVRNCRKCKKKMQKKFFFKKKFRKKIEIFFSKIFRIIFFGKFKKKILKNKNVFGFFMFRVVFEIFKVLKMDNVRLTPPFGSLWEGSPKFDSLSLKAGFVSCFQAKCSYFCWHGGRERSRNPQKLFT